MDESIRSDIAQIAGRIHYFKGNRYNPDPMEAVSGEEMLDSILSDFNGRFTNLTLYPEWAGGEVVGLDMDLLHEGKRFPLRLMTQNPKKKNNKDQRYLSEYAKLAQQGHEITWVTFRQGRELKWLGRVMDGKYIKNGEGQEVKPTTQGPPAPTDNTHTTMGHYIAQLTKELPGIPQEHILGMVTTAGKLGILR